MKILKLKSDYVRMYKPKPCIYKGLDTKLCKNGVEYLNWQPNDHLTVKGSDNKWHSYGITHPYLPQMCTESNIHEAEWQLYHCVGTHENFEENFYEDSFIECEKILYPQEREIESPNIHSPAIVQKDGLYYMFYGPEKIRYATSTDMYNWTPKGVVFEDHPTSRDPHLYEENGIYHMTYCRQDTVVMRTSTNLINWSDSKTIFKMQISGEPESPVILKHEDYYYMIWCLWDKNAENPDPYCDESFIYISKDIFDFTKPLHIEKIKAHCPEILVDEKNNYYITSAERPQRGINVALLEWVEV